MNTFSTDDTAMILIDDTVYSLDGAGNRIQVTGSPDAGMYTCDATLPEPADCAMNQYTTTPLDTLQTRAYDRNGNLLQLDAGQPSQRDFSYDYRNRLVEVTDAATGQRHVYRYDALGRRIARVVDADGAAAETRYFYSGWRVCEEQDAAGVTQATYVYGVYLDEVLAMRRGGTDHYYHCDDMHNVMAMTDSAGTVVERYEYQDFGDPEFHDGAGGAISGSAIGNPYLFTGRRFDPETGWYYYRNRTLDPRAGRFTSRDPLGIWGDDANLGNGQTYVANNPWSVLDPLGLQGEACCNGVRYDPETHCCENNVVVAKQSVYVINRSGGARTGWRGGHIDMALPGSGLVGFFGTGNGGRSNGIGMGMDGQFNNNIDEWINGPAARPPYVVGEGQDFTTADGRTVHVPGLLSTICEIKVCPDQVKKMGTEAGSVDATPGTFRPCGAQLLHHGVPDPGCRRCHERRHLRHRQPPEPSRSAPEEARRRLLQRLLPLAPRRRRLDHPQRTSSDHGRGRRWRRLVVLTS